MGAAGNLDEEARTAILWTAIRTALSKPAGGERYGSCDSDGHFTCEPITARGRFLHKFRPPVVAWGWPKIGG